MIIGRKGRGFYSLTVLMGGSLVKVKRLTGEKGRNTTQTRDFTACTSQEDCLPCIL